MKSIPQKKSPVRPSAELQGNKELLSRKAQLRIAPLISFGILLTGLAVMAVAHAAWGWPWRLVVVVPVITLTSIFVCLAVMLVVMFLRTPAVRRLIWQCAAWPLVVLGIFGLWFSAFWPSQLLWGGPVWVSTVGLMVFLMLSGLRVVQVSVASLRSGVVEAWQSLHFDWRLGMAVLGWVFIVLLFGHAMRGIAKTVLYLLPRQEAIVHASVLDVTRTRSQSKFGHKVITHWTVSLPTTQGSQTFEFDRKALFARHDALPGSNNMITPEKRCLWRAIERGDVLTLRVRQDPLWGVAIDQLLAIEGSSGPPCVTVVQVPQILQK